MTFYHKTLAVFAILWLAPLTLASQGKVTWSGNVQTVRLLTGPGLDLTTGKDAEAGGADLRIDGRTLVSDRSWIAITPGRTLDNASEIPSAGYRRIVNIDDLSRMVVIMRLSSGQHARVKIDEKAADARGYIALYLSYELSSKSAK